MELEEEWELDEVMDCVIEGLLTGDREVVGLGLIEVDGRAIIS